jgi:hypothetical protein
VTREEYSVFVPFAPFRGYPNRPASNRPVIEVHLSTFPYFHSPIPPNSSLDLPAYSAHYFTVTIDG